MKRRWKKKFTKRSDWGKISARWIQTLVYAQELNARSKFGRDSNFWELNSVNPKPTSLQQPWQSRTVKERALAIQLPVSSLEPPECPPSKLVQFINPCLQKKIKKSFLRVDWSPPEPPGYWSSSPGASGARGGGESGKKRMVISNCNQRSEERRRMAGNQVGGAQCRDGGWGWRERERGGRQCGAVEWGSQRARVSECESESSSGSSGAAEETRRNR
jgi:hypothetical protein